MLTLERRPMVGSTRMIEVEGDEGVNTNDDAKIEVTGLAGQPESGDEPRSNLHQVGCSVTRGRLDDSDDTFSNTTFQQATPKRENPREEKNYV